MAYLPGMEITLGRAKRKLRRRALTNNALCLMRQSPIGRPLALWTVAFAIAGFITLANSLHIRAEEVRAEEKTPGPREILTSEALPAGESVEFGRDILPILERSCLACHSANTAESDVVLESPGTMLAYEADDPLIVPGDASVGKLLPVAAGSQEPTMPPEDNDVGAARLTPSELGQIKRWIELGAHGADAKPSDRPILWRPIQSDRAPIMATAVTGRGAFALAAYGNAVEVYNLADGQQEAMLIDSSLRDVDPGFAKAAHLDAVRSLATFDNGERIATGGYRTVKLWRRVRTKQEVPWPSTAPASALASSASEGWIATGHADGSAILGCRGADSPMGPPVRWDAHDAKIVALAFESSGDQLVSVAEDGSARRWRIPSLEGLGDWKVSPLQTAELLNGSILATTSDDPAVRIYRLPSAPEDSQDGGKDETPAAALESDLQLRGHGREITTLAAVPDQQLLLSGSRDGFVRLWDIDAGAEKRSWIHGKAIVAVAAQRDGAHFVSIDDDGVAKTWAADQDEPTWTATVDDRSAQQLIRAKQSVQLASANVKSFQQELEAARRQQKTDQERLASAESSLAEKREALTAAIAAAEAARFKHDSAVHVSEKTTELAAAAQKMRDALPQGVANVEATVSEVDAILEQAVPSADGDTAGSKLSEGTQPGKVTDPEGEKKSDAELEQLVEDLSKIVEDVREAEKRRDRLDQRLAKLATMIKARGKSSEQIEELAKQAQQADKAVVTAQVAVGDAEDSLRRAKEGAESARLVVRQAEERLTAATQTLESRRQAASSVRAEMASASPIVAACFSDDGNQLLFASRSGVTSIFHVDGRPMGQWQADVGDLTCAQFTGDDEVVALGRQSAASLTTWNARPTWRLEQTLGGSDGSTPLLDDRVLALKFSPDGRLLVIGGGAASRSGQVVIWDLEYDSMHCQIERPHDDAVLGLAFSHDGEHLATASADRMMKVFNVHDGTHIRSFEGHTHHVLDVAWRANGLQLATASADKSIKVWDFERGEQIRTFAAVRKEVTGVEFLGVSGQMVAAGGDGAARIYNADDGKVVRTISAAGDYLLDCDVTESGELVVTAGVQRFLRAYNSSDGAERSKFAVAASTPEDP
ncbi:hypothetical protein OAS39_11430 [Pirellulales bacterium]|nr:hypothetical protein [Pirellulales bacterium]